jgi:transcriptional regulator with XRE-family HTH domain
MVYENVERIRKSKGVTKTHLAKKLGMTLQGYRHLTSGEVKLDVERLKIIAEALNVEISVFFDSKLTDTVTNAS